MQETIRKLYLCDKKQACNMSPICGFECVHTTDEKHQLFSDISEWALQRSGEETILVEMRHET